MDLDVHCSTFFSLNFDNSIQCLYKTHHHHFNLMFQFDFYLNFLTAKNSKIWIHWYLKYLDFLYYLFSNQYPLYLFLEDFCILEIVALMKMVMLGNFNYYIHVESIQFIFDFPFFDTLCVFRIHANFYVLVSCHF